MRLVTGPHTRSHSPRTGSSFSKPSRSARFTIASCGSPGRTSWKPRYVSAASVNRTRASSAMGGPPLPVTLTEGSDGAPYRFLEEQNGHAGMAHEGVGDRAGIHLVVP